MKNDKKISLYLRGDNLKNINKLAENANRKRNDVINIAIENYLKTAAK